MIDWDNIDTVLLDMDGTLLDLAFDNWFWQRHVPEQYALSRGLDYAEAERILHDWIESHLGTLNWYCLDFWTRELGLNISAQARGGGPYRRAPGRRGVPGRPRRGSQAGDHGDQRAP